MGCGYGDCLPQLRRPSRAAEKAVLRHHGRGDQTSTGSGGTADGSLNATLMPIGDYAAIVLGVLGLLSHTAGLEASAPSCPAPPLVALADAAATLRPAV